MADLRSVLRYAGLLQGAATDAEKHIAKDEAHYMDAIVRLSLDIKKLSDITEASTDPIALSVNSIAQSALEVQREWEVWRANGFS